MVWLMLCRKPTRSSIFTLYVVIIFFSSVLGVSTYLYFGIHTVRDLVSELVGSGVGFGQQEGIRQRAILWLHDLQESGSRGRVETESD